VAFSARGRVVGEEEVSGPAGSSPSAARPRRGVGEAADLGAARARRRRGTREAVTPILREKRARENAGAEVRLARRVGARAGRPKKKM